MSIVTCARCQHSISDKAEMCPNCGAPCRAKSSLRRSSKEHKKKGAFIGTLVAMIFLFFAIIWAAGLFSPSANVSEAPKQSGRADADRNPTNKALLELPELDRLMALKFAVINNDKRCDRPTQSYFQGFDDNNTAYWSIGCLNGSGFLIQFRSDAEGPASVMHCDRAAALGIDCFVKLE